MDQLLTLNGLLNVLVLAVLSLLGRWVLEARDNSRRVINAVFGDGEGTGIIHRLHRVEESLKTHEKNITEVSIVLYGRREGDVGLVQTVDDLARRQA